MTIDLECPSRFQHNFVFVWTQANNMWKKQIRVRVTFYFQSSSHLPGFYKCHCLAQTLMNFSCISGCRSFKTKVGFPNSIKFWIQIQKFWNKSRVEVWKCDYGHLQPVALPFTSILFVESYDLYLNAWYITVVQTATNQQKTSDSKKCKQNRSISWQMHSIVVS